MTTNPDACVRRIHDQPDNRLLPASRRPRITRARPDIDPVAAEAAAADLLAALGLDLDEPNLVETPRRMAQALLEMTSGRDFELTTFPNDEKYDELVLVQNIPVQSVCEHHMLPFVGVAHVGYLPGDSILGLSKFAPHGRVACPAAADPGTAHQAHRRPPRRAAQPARRRSGRRG